MAGAIFLPLLFKHIDGYFFGEWEERSGSAASAIDLLIMSLIFFINKRRRQKKRFRLKGTANISTLCSAWAGTAWIKIDQRLCKSLRQENKTNPIKWVFVSLWLQPLEREKCDRERETKVARVKSIRLHCQWVSRFPLFRSLVYVAAVFA